MSLISDMSSREKSLWVELLVDIVVALYYFPKMFAMMALGDGALTGAGMGRLVFTTIVLAIICAVAMTVTLHILEPQGKPEKKDERDRQFSARGYIGAFWVLSASVCLLMSHIIIHEIFPQAGFDFFTFTPVVIAHLLLVSLMLSSTTKSVTQLYFYRRGF